MPRLKSLVFVSIATATTVAQLPPVPDRSQEVESAKPALFVKQTVLEIGEVIEGDRPTVTWVLENRGDADLIIKQIRAGCGCTVVRLKEAEKVIPPGVSRELKADFHTEGRTGKQRKAVTVFTNDPVAPMVKLEFVGKIKSIYTIVPAGMVNLRAVRRGSIAGKKIEIISGTLGPVEVVDIQVPEGVPLRLTPEQIEVDGSSGFRISVNVEEHAALGSITTQATLKLRVGDIEQERIVPMRCVVVGDLTWTPKVLDSTRHSVQPGTRLPPLTIRSEENLAFRVLDGDAGPSFDVDVERVAKGSRGTRYSVRLTVSEDAPSGPFGTTLRVRTDSLDQPVIEVPVYGMVAPLIIIDPPLIVLRQDGTAVGTQRRFKIQASPQLDLDIAKIVCDNDAVVVTFDREASSRYHHLRYYEAKLTGELAKGEHDATLMVTTSIKGAEHLEIPVRIEVP